MTNSKKPDCRTSHCENHHKGWTIVGIIAATAIVAGAIHYFGKTTQQFPPIKEEMRTQQSYQTNEPNLLVDPRMTNLLKRLHSANPQTNTYQFIQTPPRQ